MMHDPCVIDVCHPELRTLYKRAGNYHLGLLFPETQQDKGLGSDLDLGVTSTLGLGSEAPLHSSLWISLTLATMIYTSCVKYCLLCFS